MRKGGRNGKVNDVNNGRKGGRKEERKEGGREGGRDGVEERKGDLSWLTISKLAYTFQNFGAHFPKCVADDFQLSLILACYFQFGKCRPFQVNVFLTSFHQKLSLPYKLCMFLLNFVVKMVFIQ